MTLEEFKFIILIWGCIGIAACLIMMLYLKYYQIKHPTFMTDKATRSEFHKSKKLVSLFLSGIVAYVLSLLVVTTFMAYEKPPVAMVIVFGVMLVCIISFTIAAIREK